MLVTLFRSCCSSRVCIPLTRAATTRADTFQGGAARGALSWAFIESLKKAPHQSYLQLLNSIRRELEGKYTQKPQLSCSHPLGMSFSILPTGPKLYIYIVRRLQVSVSGSLTAVADVNLLFVM